MNPPQFPTFAEAWMIIPFKRRASYLRLGLGAVGTLILGTLLAACFGARTGLREPIVDRVAFVGTPEGGPEETLVIVRTDMPTPVERAIFTIPTADDDSWPAWSPRGDALAFSRWNGGESSIFVVDMPLGRPQGTPRRVVRHRNPNRLDKHISWAGGVLAYHDDGAIWTIPASATFGTAPARLTPIGMTAQHPSWGWDGRMVFAVTAASGLSVLHIRERDGTIGSMSVVGEEPTWSDRVNAIVFTRRGDVIYRSMTTGAERVVAVNGSDPTFGPESREIAFVRDGRIWLCDVAGGNERPVTDGPRDRQPTWSRLQF